MKYSQMKYCYCKAKNIVLPTEDFEDCCDCDCGLDNNIICSTILTINAEEDDILFKNRMNILVTSYNREEKLKRILNDNEKSIL